MAVATFGLTGGIGSGKSLVGAHFAALGVAVIDADRLAREVVEPGEPALSQIALEFGPDVLLPDGRLNRAALGRVVFGDAEALERLNRIVHPRVAALLRARLERLAAEGERLACYEVPLLYENGLEAELAPVVVVTASLTVRLQRILARDGGTEAEARARIDSQMPLEEKARRADYLIDNDGSVEQTRSQAEHVLGQICTALGVAPGRD